MLDSRFILIQQFAKAERGRGRARADDNDDNDGNDEADDNDDNGEVLIARDCKEFHDSQTVRLSFRDSFVPTFETPSTKVAASLEKIRDTYRSLCRCRLSRNSVHCLSTLSKSPTLEISRLRRP